MSKKNKIPTIESFTSNPAFKTVKDNWPGTPLDQSGLFINLDEPTILGFRKIMRHLFERNPQKEIKKKDTWRIPVIKDDNWVNDPKDKIVWLGHASFFIQISGTRILIDPIFGALPLRNRLSEMPIDPNILLNIHYILISHAHFDHCDKKSVKLLAANNPDVKVLCGLKLETLISKWIVNPIQSAGWFQQYKTGEDFQITFLPSRHWANRSFFDSNTTLWGGFMIEKAGVCIYFSGDSGFGSHYSEIRNQFPNIDVALIGAGAYSPTWFMGKNHQDPYQAAESSHILGAKIFVPFHYGTFDVSEEPISETEQILIKLNAERKIKNNLKLLKPGETFLL